MKYLKRFNESSEKTFQVPSEFNNLIQDIGPNPTVSDIISCWNDCIEENPIISYKESSDLFILEDGENSPYEIFLQLNDYLMGDDVYEDLGPIRMSDEERDEYEKGRRIQSSTTRPEVQSGKLDDETLQRFKDEMKRNAERDSQKVDPYFLQEISDRLYGPDSEEYIHALKELNSKFRGREGRTGHNIFK